MNWDNESITIKGERLTLTKRGRAFFSTLTFIKDALIVSGTIGLLWLFIAVMAVFE
jgi:hypothetical protein